VNAPLPLVRTAISSQRALPVNTPEPKSSVTANRPLLTGTEFSICGVPIIVPLVSASQSAS